MGVSVDDDPDYLRAYEHLTLARLLLAERAAQRSGYPEVGSRIAALGLLQRLHDAAVDAGRDGSVLEIRILQALAHYADGDRPEALAALKRIFAYELARRLWSTSVTANPVHPGVVSTAFGAEDPAGIQLLLVPFIRPFMKTPARGLPLRFMWPPPRA